MIEHMKEIYVDDDPLYSSVYDIYIVDNEDEELQLYKNRKLMYGLDAELKINDEMIEKLKQGKILLFTGGEYYSRIFYEEDTKND